jgi:hypothetical protein
MRERIRDALKFARNPYNIAYYFTCPFDRFNCSEILSI